MRRTCLMFAVGLACAAQPAGAQPYPSRPITMVVPFAAGAPVDMVGRLFAERMRMSLGQPIILENVSGAAGSLGVARAVRAAPDGYTISLGNISSHVLNGAIYPLQFDALKRFRAGRAARQQSATDHLKECSASERPEGAHRMAEGKSRQGVSGNWWHRRRVTCRRRVLSEGNRHALSVRALSRHQPGAAGFDRRADRPSV